MEYEKAIPFKNWSLTDFTGRFGSVDYTFKAGGTYSVPQSQATHFSKQLAVRELHEHGYRKPGVDIGGDRVRGEMLSDLDVKEYADKCFPSIKPNAAESSVGSFDRLDEVKDTEAKEAVGVKSEPAPTEEDEDEEEANTSDEKNNAGAPTFKRGPGRPRTKDAEYTAA